MGKLYLYTAWTFVLCLSYPTWANVANFDNLSERWDLSDKSKSDILYEDIYWNEGNNGVGGNPGSWYIPSNPSDENYYNIPNSGSKNVINAYGCTEIGFSFPQETFESGVYVASAYFAVQGYIDNWANAIQAKGYKDNTQVWETPFLNLTTTPAMLVMGDAAVDQVVIYVQPKDRMNYGSFGMDDLSFSKVIIPEPMTLLLLALGSTAIRRRK